MPRLSGARSNGDDATELFRDLTEPRVARLVTVLSVMVGLAWPAALSVMLARR